MLILVGRCQDDSGPLWVTLAFAGCFLPSSLWYRAQILALRASAAHSCVGDGLHFSWLSGGSNCTPWKKGAQRSSADRPLFFLRPSQSSSLGASRCPHQHPTRGSKPCSSHPGTWAAEQGLGRCSLAMAFHSHTPK